MDENKPLSESGKPNANATGCLVIFFSIFLVIGLFFFYKMIFTPTWSILSALNWQTHFCKIISSEVEKHKDSDGDYTYKVKIRFDYTFNDVKYQSDRYDFTDHFSSGYESKAAIVDKYQAGSQVQCYVNPLNPTQAVINRGFTNSLWSGLPTMIFVLVGGGGIYFTLWFNRKSTPINFNKSNKINIGATFLTSRNAPAYKFAPIALVAIFWNGVVIIAFYAMHNEIQRGKTEYLPLAVISFFGLIGLGMIAGAINEGRRLLIPRAKLRLSNSVVPGNRVELHWQFTQTPKFLLHNSIFLEGHEEASYRQGTDTYTDKEIFFRHELYSHAGKPLTTQGQLSFAFPKQTMHSFSGSSNRVVWLIRVVSKIDNNEQMDEEYEINVLPVT